MLLGLFRLHRVLQHSLGSLSIWRPGNDQICIFYNWPELGIWLALGHFNPGLFELKIQPRTLHS